MKSKFALLAPLVLIGGAATSSASLIPYNLVNGQLVETTAANFTPINQTGTGFGTVNTILTLQNTGTEAGCVVPTATAAQTCAGLNFDNGGGITDVKSGASQIGTPNLTALGISAANQLVMVFNGVQPAGGSISFNSLALILYGTGGTSQAFTLSPTFNNLTLPNTLVGTGNSGFIFGLDAAQSQAANTWIGTHGGFGTVTVGAGSSLSGAAGGNETFYAGNIGAAVPVGSEVPEPASLTMLGAGLVGLSLVSRRWMRAQ